MYIKQICIDGFKSYAQRTVIDGFDPSFNAITGLNGSGKSNILDSICFVLGITNLSQVRAASLQDLVYKSGQAGITRATVSITFDNSNKQQSPVGYEQYNEITVTRQVVIGGRNKYLINGTNAQNNRVIDLFHSVQMNVNNPHFLIMQGRITKVLNMKPPEILSMIEEAAGTKMYESKKDAALRTIEKKEAKLHEIDQILAEEITPKLEKLKNDRASYVEYQRLDEEIQQLSRITVAFEYVRLKEGQKNTKAKVAAIRERVVDTEKGIGTIQEKCDAITKEIKQLEARISAEIASGQADSLQALEAALAECQKKETVATTAVEHRRDAMKVEEKNRSQLAKRVEKEKVSLAGKVKNMEDLVSSIAECENQAKRAEGEADEAHQKLQALSMGLSSGNEDDAATASAQLLAAKDELSRAEADHKQAELKLQRLRPELKKFRTSVGQAESSYMDARKVYDNGLGEITRLEARLKELNYEEGSEERLRNERRQLAAEVEQFRRQVFEVEDSLPRLKFNYHNPSPNFDRSGVYGPVAKLIRLKDPNTATAIEVAAGERLYNVIVENENVAKEILKHGQLQQRVTFIPLNKIAPQVIADGTVRRAKSLVGDNNCDLALNVVHYQRNLQRAMEYVFGNTLLCTDMDAAKAVTFDPQVRKRSVTLRGEIFDPQGTLTGGSRKESAMVMNKLQEANRMTDEINQKQNRVKAIDNILTTLAATANEWRGIQEKLIKTRRDVEAAKITLEGTDQHRQMEAMRQTEQALKETEETLANCADVAANARRRIKELEDRTRNAEKYHETETKRAEQQLKEAKERAEAAVALLRQTHEGTGALQLEINELQGAIDGYQGELADSEKEMEKMEKDIADLITALNTAKEAVREADERVSERREAVKARSKEITDRQRDLDEQVKERRKAELQIKTLQQEEENVIEDANEAAKKLDYMAATYGWIRRDEQFFGQEGTAYDFGTNDPKDANRRLQAAHARKQQLQRTVNMRAMTMLGKAEEQYDDLINKKAIVENDKSKIETVIRELDDKKRQAIEKAWAQVNRDFGSIFSTLLPGANAKLEPPPGQTPLDGLEVRVGFGDVWKESLAELSGGQRSLVALSLILAMLLFKPAPIYILDEVDAALDISHTQNIGQMLRNHFTHSQFIVVSLKEGMFNNANVLFQTKFVDGCSTVTRKGSS